MDGILIRVAVKVLDEMAPDSSVDIKVSLVGVNLINADWFSPFKM